MTTLTRAPQLEWSHRSARGELPDLGWVDATVEVHRSLYRAVAGEDAPLRFQSIPYSLFAPPLMTEAAAEAQTAGRATLQEALLLLYARPEWIIANRGRLWTPTTPIPAVLIRLCAAYGVAPELHRADPEVLLRLVALLPSWFPRRGSLPAARQVLEAARLEAEGAAHAAEAPDLRGEILCCHSAAWWEARAAKGARPALRIQAGLVLFQPPSGGWPLRKEDVALPIATAAAGLLSRLTPPWAVLRPTLPAEASP
jgi:hypothetical protein